MALRLWYRHCWQAPSLWPDAFKWPLPPHARIFFVSEISSENSFYCNNRPAKPYSQLFYNKATSHINNTQTQPVAAPGPNGCFLHFPQAPLSRALQRWAPQLGVCHWALWGAQRTGEARPGQARQRARSLDGCPRQGSTGDLCEGHTPSPGSPALLCAHPDLSNPVSEPKSIGSQRGGSFLTGKHSLRDRASQPPHYPKRCPFVLHHPCFPLSADPFSLAPQAAHHAEARF